MTQEEKDLLLKYLCMALPYGVVCCCEWKDSAPNGTVGVAPVLDTYILDQIECIGECDDALFKSCKPYLRSLSSMTEEEKKEHFGRTMTIDIIQTSKEVIGWLLKNHFDFMDLIPKGLAIEVTESNNPYENNN